MIAIAFLFVALVSASPFSDNEEMVRIHNSAKKSFSLTMSSPFAEMPWETFQESILMSPQDCSATMGRESVQRLIRENLPVEVDWREKGVVTEVKSQGYCGSCWTFSTTGALEAHHAIQFGMWRTSLLSEQQLIDCAQAFDNKGCSGGLPSHAFEYVRYAKGLSEEFSYPYAGKDATCRYAPGINSTIVGATVYKSFNVTEGDEDSIMAIVATKGPVSIAFQVASDFRLYHSGVYSSTQCKNGTQDVNHAVLVVGYGTEQGVPYWLIKNSWGPKWGEEGYFKMERGKNMCGLAACASYPVLQSDGDDDDDNDDVSKQRPLSRKVKR